MQSFKTEFAYSQLKFLIRKISKSTFQTLTVVTFLPDEKRENKLNKLLLDTATWLCQVKECKIISEPSLLTGWLTD